MRVIAIIIFLLSSNAMAKQWIFGEVIQVPTYQKCHYVSAAALPVGATAPVMQTIGTFRGAGFDDANDELHVMREVGDDYVANTDVTFKIYWTNEAGTAIANTKKVIWQITYRNEKGSTIDAGTVTVASTTYTQSGAGVDKEYHHTSITMPYNDVNNPIAVDDTYGISLKRDTATEAGDTYPADAVAYAIEFCYTSNGIPTH